MTALQVLLDKNVSLTSIYSYALRLSWPALEIDEPPRWVPPRWNEHLHHYYEVTNLAKWWADEDDSWQTAVRHLEDIFSKIDFYTFLEPFFGSLPETLVFLPNISYPNDMDVRVRVGAELCALIPPRKAWGDSPPWPYDNDPVYIYQETLRAYEELLMTGYLRQYADTISTLSEKPLPVGEKFAALHTTWSDQLIGLFVSATTAMFLEEVVNVREAKAFVQMQQKIEGIDILPGVISILRRYVEEQKTGKYGNFAEYLPNFAKHLRVVKTLSAL